MALKEYLTEELQGGGHLPGLTMPPERPSQLERAILELPETTGRPPAPPPDLNQVEHRLRWAFANGRLDELTRREWREAPWCLWRGDRPLLAEQPQFLKNLFARCTETPSRLATRTLIQVYLREFAPNKPGFPALAKTIAQVVNNWDWTWRDRQRDYALFDHQQGPKHLADIIQGQDGKDPMAVLEHAGLRHDLAFGAFAQAAFGTLLQRWPEVLGHGADAAQLFLNKLCVWAWAPTQEGNLGHLRYPALRKDLAETLLLPFVNRNPATEQLRTSIRDFLVDKYGDPRTNPQNWWQINERAKAVLLRWMVQFSLNQFIGIVRLFADKQEPDQWRYREAFWMGYFRRGFIREAWVVLAPDPADFAERRAKEHNDPGMRSFGHMTEWRNRQHAVLLLRLGDLVIADWSFNGSCRIWHANDQNALRLYQSNYQRRDLIAQNDQDMVFKHAASQNATWQGAIVERIRKLTGITLPQREYMPQGWHHP